MVVLDCICFFGVKVAEKLFPYNFSSSRIMSAH